MNTDGPNDYLKQPRPPTDHEPGVVTTTDLPTNRSRRDNGSTANQEQPRPLTDHEPGAATTTDHDVHMI